jgi:microcin C transport system substrate-binding protein
MVYDFLLSQHPTTLEYIPSLATHWQISPDKSTYRFRINPNARWADGKPVIADDVVATWTLFVDKGIQDPALNLVWNRFNKPVAESKYIVSVKTKEPSWQNFMYFAANLEILPAHALKDIDGKKYVSEYNHRMVLGSGPYAIAEKDVEKGKSMSIRRRTDYWGAKDRQNVGLYNFDEIRISVVRDREIEFEMFKKGDRDFYFVNRAQMWAEQLDFDNIKRGVVQKRRIYNHNPNGTQGLAFNTRRPPYDDIRVRKALAMLFNRERMIEKLMYNAYMLQDSIYPGGIYESPKVDKIRYNPEGGLQLLAEAGWKDRDSQGRLTKGGVPLQVEILYSDENSLRFFNIFQEDVQKIGITLNLRKVTPETLIKLLDERKFDLVSIAYTGTLFPDPEREMHSKLADQLNNNNLTGFKDPRVDELTKQYQLAYDLKDRIKILQEIDERYSNAHQWILEWYAPYERLVFWNRYGTPVGYLSRTGDWRDMFKMWWLDPEKSKKLDDALKDTSIKLGEGPADNKYWLDFAKAEEKEQDYAPATKAK